jgi:hypothetical protein
MPVMSNENLAQYLGETVIAWKKPKSYCGTSKYPSAFEVYN